jgi:hypothetical protein
MNDSTVYMGHKNHDHKRDSLKISSKTDEDMVQAQVEDAPIAHTVEKWDTRSKLVMN